VCVCNNKLEHLVPHINPFLIFTVKAWSQGVPLVKTCDLLVYIRLACKG
jgi:hypothetical protein